MRQQTAEIEVYAQMGIAALIPGMQYMLERMQKELDGMRAQLGLLQTGKAEKAKAETPHVAGGRRQWAGMNAAERSREMKRRIKARAAKLHPRDPRHPEHAKWVAKMRKTAKKKWAALDEAGRAKLLRKMQRGKDAKAKMAAAPPVTVRQALNNGSAVQ